MITAIYIGVDRLTLFEDEDITIKNRVVDIEDITKIFTDTSNSFSVPADDNNNRIFKHYYNANVLDGFDARKKHTAVIELNGINYKVGKISLNNVNMKSNRPSSYGIDFFGNLVELKDLLSDDKLSALDLSAYDFAYTSIGVGNKLVNEGDVIMSLFGHKRYLYDSSDSVLETDKQTNIYFNGTDGNSGIKFNEPKASIKALAIIKAIESKYSITFSREFFGGNEFSNLFLLLSDKIDNELSEEIPITVSDDPTIVGNTLLANDEVGTEKIFITFSLYPGFENSSYTFILKSDGVVISETKSTGLGLSFALDVVDFNTFRKITFEVVSDSVIRYSFDVRRFTSPSIFYTSSNLDRTISSNYVISENTPDLKVIDYLSGLFKLYKLVAIYQKDGSIYVDSLSNFYRKGKVYNMDKYIDYKDVKISRGKILNEIKYNFEPPTTILNKQFKENNEIAYGDLELSIYDDNGQLIDGDSQEYDVPFEQIVYERISDLSGIDSVNAQYALLTDESINPKKPKAHLHYNYYAVMDSPIKFISDTGVGTPFYALNTPMHTLGIDSPVFSTVFGEEFNEYNGNLITETIFKEHHSKYIEGVFSSKRRVYKIEVKNLPKGIIQEINLNDVLEIKETYYRIDSMDVNITTGDVSFKLINAIDLDLTPIYSMSLDRVDVTLDNILITLDNI